jgi:hypothetical protein
MKLGTNQICINPTRPMLPVGFVTQDRNLSQVRGDLIARMLLVEDESNRWLCITMDSLGVSQAFFHKVREKVNVLFPDCELTMSCSHTHYAPSLANVPGMFEENQIYVDFVLERMVHCLRNLKLVDVLDPRIGYKSERFSDVGKNRNCLKSDDDVIATVVSLFDGPKRIVNFLHYNCHPTISSEDAAYFTADYVSIAIEQITDKFPNEFTLFFQGAAGDISTRFTRTQKTYNETIRLGRMLGIKFLDLRDHVEVTEAFTLHTQMKIIELHPQIKNIDDLDTSHLNASELGELETARKIMTSVKNRRSALAQTARFTDVKIGPLRFCFLPFELFSGYLRYCHPFTLIVGYSQGYAGYVTLPDNTDITYESLLETVTEVDKRQIIAFLEDKA